MNSQWITPKAVTSPGLGSEDLHLQSWKGLTKAGVHVRQQDVDVGRRQVLDKLNMLNNMSAKQIEEYQQKLATN